MAESNGCIICGQAHDAAYCNSPAFPIPCSQCFVTSLDGNDHDAPCMPYSNKCSYRQDVYACEPIELFKMKLSKNNDWFYIGDNTTKEFEMVKDTMSLTSAAAECSFHFDASSHGNQIVTCNATAITRFSVFLAFVTDGQWRFRFRFLISDDKGILCFPMRKVLLKRS